MIDEAVLDLGGEIRHVAPLAVVAVSASLLVLTGTFASLTRSFQRPLALVAVLGAMVMAWPIATATEYDAGFRVFDGVMVADHLSGYLDLLLLFATGGTIALAHGEGPGHGEREPLLLLGALGGMLLAHAGDLVLVYAGVELIGIAVCVLAFTGHGRRRDNDAAWRAFVGMVLTSAFMLMGLALLYAALSSTQMGGLAGRSATVFNQWGAVQRYVGALEAGRELPSGLVAQFHGKVVTGMAPASLFIPGMLLLLAGVLGKLAVVPFHLLRGRIVEGVPTQVAAFLLTAEPVAWVALLLRVFVELLHVARLVNEPYGWTGMIPTIAIATMLLANLSALRERSLPRLVGLFSLSAIGNVLLGIVAAANFYGHRSVVGGGIAPHFETTWAQIAGDAALTSSLICIGAWVVAGLGLMAAVAATRGEGRSGLRLEEWAGLARARPGLALAVTVCQFSLLGVPPLLGFLGSWSLLRVLLEHSSLSWLALVLALNLALATAAHVRVLGVIHARTRPAGHRLGWHSRSAGVAALMAAVLLLGGVFGTPVVRSAMTAAAGASLAVGHERRVRWLEGERIRWAREAAGTTPDSPVVTSD